MRRWLLFLKLALWGIFSISRLWMVPSDNEPSGLLIDMGKFVKSSIDKLTNLVKPQSETAYDAPPPVKTYSLGKSNWSKIF